MKNIRWLAAVLMPLLGVAQLARSSAEPRVHWQPAVEVASGAGLRGPWQQNASRYDFVDDPSAALLEDGTLLIAWVDQSRKGVLVQRRGADGAPAGAPVEIDRQPGTFSWIPRIVVAPDAPRRVLVLWQEIIFSGGSHGGEMMLARSDDGGRTFTPPMNLSRSRGGDGKGRINPDVWHNGSYALAVGPGGRVHAAWTEYDGLLWTRSSTDGGRSFSPPRRVAGGPGQPPARAPSIALGAGKAVYLAWTQGDDPGADIRVACSVDGGRTFAPAQVVGPSRAYSDAPRLAVDADRVVHLAYAESEGPPLARQRILYTRSTDGARSFQPVRVLTPDGPQPHLSAGYPSLAVDGDRGVYVLWEWLDDVRSRPRALGLAVSSNGGDRFGQPEAVPYSRDPRGGYNGSSQGLLEKLAVNSRGDIAIVNSALLEGSHSRVWLMRGRCER